MVDLGGLEITFPNGDHLEDVDGHIKESVSCDDANGRQIVIYGQSFRGIASVMKDNANEHIGNKEEDGSFKDNRRACQWIIERR